MIVNIVTAELAVFAMTSNLTLIAISNLGDCAIL